MKPRRIQLKRTKGWRMPPNTVVVSRPSKWGNPHTIGICAACGVEHEPGDAVAEFRAACDIIGVKDKIIAELRGKNLACWCKLAKNGCAVPCHADILLSLANDIPLEKIQHENIRRSEGEAP